MPFFLQLGVAVKAYTGLDMMALLRMVPDHPVVPVRYNYPQEQQEQQEQQLRQLLPPSRQLQEVAPIEIVEVRNRISSAPFDTKHDRFTKTGSGQT
eukprot:COSAG06_NODE_5334_length_3541_cov_7.544451_2_plen_96_part_00